jgi:hypothetical protein
MPAQITATISGVPPSSGANYCAHCDLFNGTYTLNLVDQCTYEAIIGNTGQPKPCGPFMLTVKPAWTATISPLNPFFVSDAPLSGLRDMADLVWNLTPPDCLTPVSATGATGGGVRMDCDFSAATISLVPSATTVENPPCRPCAGCMCLDNDNNRIYIWPDEFDVDFGAVSLSQNPAVPCPCSTITGVFTLKKCEPLSCRKYGAGASPICAWQYYNSSWCLGNVNCQNFPSPSNVAAASELVIFLTFDGTIATLTIQSVCGALIASYQQILQSNPTTCVKLFDGPTILSPVGSVLGVLCSGSFPSATITPLPATTP